MNEIWEIISDIIVPHMGRLIFNTVGFSLLGILVSVLLLVFMFQKKILTRTNTAYKIIIRVIYIPLVILVTIYSFGHYGFVRGVYKIMSAENPRVVNGIYNITVNQIFSTEIQKDVFLKDVKRMAGEAESTGRDFGDYFETQITTTYLVDTTGSGFISKITRRYKKEIYKAVLSGLLYAADLKFDTDIKYSELNKALDLLYATDMKKIAFRIKNSLIERIQYLIDRHYRSAWVSILIFWLIAMSIPFIEFLVYKQWIEKKEAQK